MSTATLTVEAEESRPNGVWDYISPSRLNLWLRCPLAFKAAVHRRDSDSRRRQPCSVGQRVHDALEVHYRHRQLGIALDASRRRAASH